MNRILKPLQEHESAKQFARFAAVGCLNFAVSLAVFVLSYSQWRLGALLLDSTGSLGAWIAHLLNELDIHVIDAAIANTAGYLAGMTTSFFLNKFWTFEMPSHTMRQMHRFVIVNVFCLILSSLILLLFVDILGGPYLLVWCMTTGITMVFSFVGNKYWTFSKPLRHASTS